MKLIKCFLIVLLLGLANIGFAKPDDAGFWTILPQITAKAYVHQPDAKTKNIQGCYPGVYPYFLIYPDKACTTEEQATELVEKLGLEECLNANAASVCIMNPVGKTYNVEKDFQNYKDYVNNTHAPFNLKVIGIGKGATFVDQAIAHHAGLIADIALINPSSAVTNAKVGVAPVPVYIYGKNATKIAKDYIQLDKCTANDVGNQYNVYSNKKEPLLKVVVDNEKNIDLKSVIKRAWYVLLKRNYRFDNFRHSFYKGAKFEQYEVANELEPCVLLDELKIKKNVVEKDLIGIGAFLWYEYFPESTLNASKGTIPLVVLLHGNTNDPRTQAETSGFLELSAKENFAVAELEWQGGGYTPMGFDGIEQVIYYLLKQYPQLDPSRVYAEGLSAGCITATGLGVKKPYLFAAVGGHSGGIFPNNMYKFGFNREALMNEAEFERNKVLMPYFTVQGTYDDELPFPKQDNYENTALFNAIQIYEALDGLDVTDKADFSVYPIFGLELQSRKSTPTNKGYTVESGYLYKGNIPLIKINAIPNFGHWNFKPDAKMMWDFFKHFSRNQETRELVYKP